LVPEAQWGLTLKVPFLKTELNVLIHLGTLCEGCIALSSPKFINLFGASVFNVTAE